jgi:CDK inhibitor PHO81
VEGLDLGVSEVTYDQFQAIVNKSSDSAARTEELRSVTSAQQAQSLVSLCYTSLANLLSALHPMVHLNLQILYPTNTEREHLCIDFVPEINDYTDAILQAVFESAESSQSTQSDPSAQQNRTLLFSSFNPDICTTINWKQPNCGPFLATLANV